MAYRQDNDLNFLAKCSSKDLDTLVTILTKDKDGKTRYTEELTQYNLYKMFWPDHHRYWELIAAVLQCFGANTFATWTRGGEGVLYREILIDVCDSMRVNYNAHANIERIEMNLLLKILTDSMDEMTPEDLSDLVNELGIKTTNFSKQTLIIATQTSIKMSGFVAYKLAVIVANAVAKAVTGKGLALVVNATLARAINIAVGPIGWTLTALWTLKDVAGPAFRVTIPCVVQVAFLRTMINQQNITTISEQKTRVCSRISPDSIFK
jgi:uncharacterized protein YaaW (UPF0174 family)